MSDEPLTPQEWQVVFSALAAREGALSTLARQAASDQDETKLGYARGQRDLLASARVKLTRLRRQP